MVSSTARAVTILHAICGAVPPIVLEPSAIQDGVGNFVRSIMRESGSRSVSLTGRADSMKKIQAAGKTIVLYRAPLK